MNFWKNLRRLSTVVAVARRNRLRNRFVEITGQGLQLVGRGFVHVAHHDQSPVGENRQGAELINNLRALQFAAVDDRKVEIPALRGDDGLDNQTHGPIDQITFLAMNQQQRRDTVGTNDLGKLLEGHPLPQNTAIRWASTSSPIRLETIRAARLSLPT